MSTDFDTLLGITAPTAPRMVSSQLGTTRENGYANARVDVPVNVDTLFNESPGYVRIKHEKPEHRLILWYRLQGYTPKEIASLVGVTPQTVSNVSKQPWFTAAFCALAAEQGKDVIQTMLEGEVLPALQRTVELATSAESDAVRLGANREILDRFLGKSVAKTEVKSTGNLDVQVYDVAKLLDEQRRNAEILRGRGIGGN